MAEISLDDEVNMEDETEDHTKKLSHYSSLTRSDTILSSSSSSPSLGRSESSLSLISSSLNSSAVTAMEVRDLTSNFQSLLSQATKQIRSLNIDKQKLEEEQTKLLATNVELAIEIKQVLMDLKQSRVDKQDLLVANEEFAAEVSKLDQAEETWMEDKDKFILIANESRSKIKELSKDNNDLIKQNEYLSSQQEDVVKEKEKLSEEGDKLENIREGFQKQVEHLSQENNNLLILIEKEREKQEEQKYEMDSHVLQLKISMDILAKQKEQLTKQIKEIQSVKENTIHKHKSDDNNKEIDAELSRLECRISSLQKDLKIERNQREEMELKCLELEEQVERRDGDLITFREEEMNIFKDANNKLFEENTKYAVEHEDIIRQLKTEKEKCDRLTNRLEEVEGKSVEKGNKWRYSYNEQNRMNIELREENLRLISRSEGLEKLLNDEVTDINEIITVINKIQDDGDLVEQSRTSL